MFVTCYSVFFSLFDFLVFEVLFFPFHLDCECGIVRLATIYVIFLVSSEGPTYLPLFYVRFCDHGFFLGESNRKMDGDYK